MLKKTVFPILLVFALTGFCYAQGDTGQVVQVEPLQQAPSAETGVMTDETPSLWFVELSSPPIADGASLATVRAQKDAFRANARRAGLQYTERYAFDKLFNGLSISMNASQLNKLYRIAGVKNIYPVDVIRLPETTPSEPDLWTALAMTGADIAQSELGYTGKGIKVAVVDTGIDYDHKALGGDGVVRTNSAVFPTARVIAGWDFVGDTFNADSTSATYNPSPSPDPYPDDCYGHGTHVSGIIGANDPTNGLKGVAPDVTFGAYRVFGCAGSTTADIMIAAMEQAWADGMQVLNMSIGSAYQWPQYPTAMAATRLVNKGVVVVGSIGNNGENGLFSAGAPGLGEKVIGAASYENTHIYLPSFAVNGRGIGYITMAYSPNPPTSGTYQVMDVGLACSALTSGSLTGKVALAARGTCSFAIKATNAINAGAAAVLISNNVPGVFSGTLGGPLPDPKPVVGISLEDGNFIRAQTTPIDMTWTDEQASSPGPNGGLISYFSSYGLSPDLVLKPDIGSPGGYIYSTYPLELGGYITMSGTSMSSPHVAGSAALLLQARPNTPAQAVRGILQNVALPRPWGGQTSPYIDNVHRQGAGMVQIDKAILSTTKITPAKISAGEGQAGPYKQKLTIENKAQTAVTYDLSYVNALSTGGVITPTFWDSDASVSFSKSSVTVPSKSAATVTATIYPASGPTNGQYGGYIVFTPRDDGQVYSVPFAGFVGDYQGIQVLTSGGYGFPWLALLYNGSYYKAPEAWTWTYTMQAGNVPYFFVHCDHQSRLIRFEVFDAISGQAWHRFYEQSYVPRNSISTSYFYFPWDGSTFTGGKTYTVPDGQYIVKISVLKALGNQDNPADWETWTSPTIVIDRP